MGVKRRILIINLLVTIIVYFGYLEKIEGSSDLKSEVLPPCQACKTVVTSILNGITKTTGKTLDGKSIENDLQIDTLTLASVKTKICSDVNRGQNQCYKLAKDWASRIEQWWFDQKELEPIYDWLCIKETESCCPENHFGPECKPCIGHPDNICSKNGRCKGSGTRKGNGNCVCNTGYREPTCNECSENHYESYRDDKKLLCSKCHPACKGHCTKAGPKGCTDCAPGWMKNSERGCLDVNECLSENTCKLNQFCINNEGSYSCLACDDSCDGCHGDGPDMCNKCSSGYQLKNGLCVVNNKDMGDWSRYLTYTGLCFATCIIFQNNAVVAGVIGLSVAVYVAVSEYMLNNLPTTDQKQLLQNNINSFLNQ